MAKLSEYAFVASIFMTGLALVLYLIVRDLRPAGRPPADRGRPRHEQPDRLHLRPAHRRDRPLRDDARLARDPDPAGQPGLPDDRHRPRPVREHVRVLDGLRLRHPRHLPVLRAQVPPAHPGARRPAGRAGHAALRGHHPGGHRAARPRPAEQPPPDRPRRHRHRRLRLVRDRVRRVVPLPGPDRVGADHPVGHGGRSHRGARRSHHRRCHQRLRLRHGRRPSWCCWPWRSSPGSPVEGRPPPPRRMARAAAAGACRSRWSSTRSATAPWSSASRSSP